MEHNRIVIHFLLGGAYGLALSLGPVLLINHRHIIDALTATNLPIHCFYFFSSLNCAVAAVWLGDKTGIEPGKQADSTIREAIQVASDHLFELFGSFAIFLFIACAALAAKLETANLPNLTLLPSNFWSYLGLVLIVLGQFVQLKAIREKRNVPIYLCWLIFLVGISWLFKTWFTLIAVPGAIVVVKWRLRRLA